MPRFLSLLALALLPLPALGAVTGTVVGEDGRAAAGATITALALESSQQQRARWLSADPARKALATAVADAAGNFVLDPKARVFDLRVDVAGRPAVGVRAADGDDAGVVRVSAPPMARGTVTANGKPLAGVTIIVRFAGAESVLTSDAAGRYAVPDPKRLVSRILVRHPRFAPVARELGPLTSQSADVAMTAGIALTGRVVADAPVGNAVVEVDDLPLASTGAGGAFAIEHAPAGARTIVARAADRIAVRQLGGERNVVLRLSSAAAVTGSVLDGTSGAPIAGAEVIAAPPRFGDTEHGLRTISDEKGNYAIRGLAGGEIELTAIHPGYATPRITLNLPGGRAARTVLYAAALARIAGAVVDERGRGIAGATVTPRKIGGGEALPNPGLLRTVQSAITAPDGHFVVATSEDGSLQIDASRAGWPAAHSAALRVAPGARVRGVTISMPYGVALTGRVLGSERKPVAGAGVGVAGDVVRTGDDGTFALRVLEGTVDVAVTAAGYAPRTLHVPVSASSPPLEILLESGVAVSGRVTRGGAPVEGVNVYVVGGGAADAPVQTAADGTFRIGDLAAGDVRIAFRKPSDLIQTTRNVTAPANDVHVDLPAGARVSGRVVDKSSKKPVTVFDAGLAISRPGSAIMLVAPVMRSFTSDDGTFSIDGVPPGTHTLAVSAPGYVMARVPNVTTENGKSIEAIEVELDGGVRVSGHVTGPDGAPLGGVLVLVDPRAATHGAAGNDPYTLTDPDGAYVLENAEQGETTLAFSRSGLLTLRKNATLSGTSAQIDAQLSAGASIAGVVLLEGGTPVANAQVQASSAADAAPARFAQTDDGGAFSIAAVAPGHYEITATKPGYGAAALHDVGVPAPAALRLVMKGGGTISGRLIGLTPAELRGAAVQASSDDGVTTSAAPDESGRYRLDGAPAGTLRMSARSGPFTTSARTAQTKSVSVESGGSVTVDFDFTAGITVSGRVSRNGVPQPGATVAFLSPTASQRSARATADGNGHYEIGGIDEGAYNVTVLDRTNVPYTTSFEVRGSSTFDIDMRGVSVSGRVTDAASGVGVANAAIELRRNDAAPDLRATLSDAAGAFSFAEVPSGSYEASVRKAGYGAASAAVTVGDGSTPPVEVKLTPSSGLRLRVVDGRDGRPLTAWVHAESSAGESYDGTVAASAEAAAIGLAAGAYRITAGAAGYAPASQRVAVPGEQTIALTPGGTIVITSTSDAFAFARIVDAGGQPVRFGPGPATDVFRVDPAPGQTRIANVAAGTYTLQLLAGETVLRSATVTVREGESVPAKL